MELIYATVIGAGLALVLRYVLPRRDSYGVMLMPAIGAAATAAIWVGMLWALNLTLDNPLLWLASLGGAVVLAVVVALVVSRGRVAADAREVHVLSGGKA